MIAHFTKKTGFSCCDLCGEAAENCCVHASQSGRKYVICPCCAEKLFGYGKKDGVEIDVAFDLDRVSIHGIAYPATLHRFLIGLQPYVKNVVRRESDPVQIFVDTIRA